MEREDRNKRPYCSICAAIGKLCLNSGSWTFEAGQFPLGHGQRCWYLAGQLGMRSTTGKKGGSAQERLDPRKHRGIRCTGAELGHSVWHRGCSVCRAQ